MNGWHTYMTAVMAWLTVAWSLDNPRMSDFCKANMWHKACLSTDKCALLVLRGWLKPSLPLCMWTRVCVCVQHVCLLVCVALQPTSFRRTLKGNRNSTNSWLSHRQSQTCLCVYVLVRKKEKRRKKRKKREKGTRKKKSKTTKTSSRDYLSHTCQHWCPLKVRIRTTWGQLIPNAIWKELYEGTAGTGRRTAVPTITWTTACKLTCPGPGLVQIARSRRSLSIPFFFSITIGWRTRQYWIEGLPSLNMYVMKKKWKVRDRGLLGRKGIFTVCICI